MKYPTREELQAGAPVVPAVPASMLLKVMTTRAGHFLDRWTVRLTGFSFIAWEASRARGIPYQRCLILTTIGRKSGVPRSAVLPYVKDGVNYLVVASNAGGARNPLWLENALANERCSIVVSRRRMTVVARLARNEERERLMSIIAVCRPHIYNYAAHAERNGRRLELLVLKPDAPDG